MIPRAHVDVVDLDEPVSDILAKMSDRAHALPRGRYLVR